MGKLFFAIALFFAGPALAQFQPATDGITFPPKAWASLPDVTKSTGLAFFVADAPGGASLVISDGTVWRPFARNISSQTYTLTAADNGLHTFTFSATAKPNVQYSIEDNTTTGLLTSNLQGVTTTSATVRVNRGLLAALTGGTTTGVIINLLVVPTN
jgi:hypothetical protein